MSVSNERAWPLLIWPCVQRLGQRLLSFLTIRVGSTTAATSKMECFVIRVNGLECFILDGAAALDLPLWHLEVAIILIEAWLLKIVSFIENFVSENNTVWEAKFDGFLGNIFLNFDAILKIVDSRRHSVLNVIY